MKTRNLIQILMIAVIGFAGLSFTVEAIKATLKVDTKKSSVNWKGEKIGGEHVGTIDISSGSVEMTDGKLTGGEFEIDMKTIKTTDLSGESAGKLEGHLKSADFFGVDNFPKSSFKITKAVWQGGDNYKIVGEITIKSTTKEIKFPATVKDGGKTVSAKITVDRTDFDVKYGSGSFFDNLGDNVIYDNFELEVNLVTK